MDRGSMGLLLKISRLAGIAPFKYAPEFELSRDLVLYGRVFMIFNVLLYFICLVGFCITINHEGVVADNIIKTCGLSTLAVVTTIGVFTAPARLTRMDHYFKRLNQIEAKLENISEKKMFQKSNYKIIIFFGGYIFLRLAHLVIYLSKSKSYLDAAIKIMRTLFFTVNLCITILLQLQITFFAQRVNLTLIAMNDTLKILFDDVRISHEARDRVPTRKIETGNEKILPHVIREIATSYLFICKIVLRTTRADGAIMILVLLYMTVHLEIELYPVFSTIVSSPIQRNFMNYSNHLLTFWCMCCIFFIIYCIEQFHRTHCEMRRTRDLIISRKSKDNEREEEHELELFYRILTLNYVRYSPLSICTIDRPLMMKLFGCLVTYLVMIVQYGVQTPNPTQLIYNATDYV